MKLDRDLREEIAFLSAASRQELIVRWNELFGAAAPKQLSTSLLRRGVMHQVQVEAFGGLSPSHRKALLEAAGRTLSIQRNLKPGGRLVREWNGVAHTVDVIEGGFRYKERTYGSLTAIAAEITGTHWSGPRFFGVRTKSR